MNFPPLSYVFFVTSIFNFYITTPHVRILLPLTVFVFAGTEHTTKQQKNKQKEESRLIRPKGPGSMDRSESVHPTNNPISLSDLSEKQA